MDTMRQAMTAARKAKGELAPEERLAAAIDAAAGEPPYNIEISLSSLKSDLAHDAEMMLLYAERRWPGFRETMLTDLRRAIDAKQRNDGGDGATGELPSGRIRNAPPAVAATPARAAGGGQAVNVAMRDRHQDAPAGFKTRASAGGEGQATHANSGHAHRALPAAPSEPTHIATARAAAANRIALMRSEAWREVTSIVANGKSIMDTDITPDEFLTWSDVTEPRIKLGRVVCSLIPNRQRPIREQMTLQIAEEAHRLARGIAT